MGDTRSDGWRDAATRAERRLKLALELSEMVIWELNPRARRLDWWGGDPAQMFGRLPDFDSVMTDELGFVDPQDRERVAACWAQLGPGHVARCEYRVCRPDRALLWVSSSREDLYDDQGALIGAVGVLRDITRQKRAAAALDTALAEARAASRAKSDFLANMSHEIRTPLNGVLGVAGALARTDLSETQAEMVALIEGSGQTLQTLLSDILDLARVEAGKLEIAPIPFNLPQLANQLGKLFEAEARRKGLELVVRIDPVLAGHWLGDASRIRQVLCNLISNAVKFTARGGVTMDVRPVLQDAAEAVAFEVTDTGIGFDEAFARSLFQRFTQADSSITRRFGGSGLGLSISRALADLMGGALSAQATPGAGATFRLVLPLSRCAAPQPLPKLRVPAPGAPAQRPLRVLLAEDHPTNRRVVELILQEAPVILTCVEDGAAAVAAVAACGAEPFDLILMDMQMPVMDGLAATRAIRESERWNARPRTPIFALTANALPEHMEASRGAGADRHLTKPIAAEELLAVIAEHLAERG